MKNRLNTLVHLFIKSRHFFSFFSHLQLLLFMCVGRIAKMETKPTLLFGEKRALYIHCSAAILCHLDGASQYIK